MESFPVYQGVKLSDPRLHKWAIYSKFGLMVEVNLNTGEITYGKNYTPDEAAKVFWEAIGRRGGENVQLD